jgi:hypothetical protein
MPLARSLSTRLLDGEDELVDDEEAAAFRKKVAMPGWTLDR